LHFKKTSLSSNVSDMRALWRRTSKPRVLQVLNCMAGAHRFTEHESCIFLPLAQCCQLSVDLNDSRVIKQTTLFTPASCITYNDNSNYMGRSKKVMLTTSSDLEHLVQGHTTKAKTLAQGWKKPVVF